MSTVTEPAVTVPAIQARGRHRRRDRLARLIAGLIILGREARAYDEHNRAGAR